MSRAAIFFSPALYEPFGLGVLEAAARGCALVLADIPSFIALKVAAHDLIDTPRMLQRWISLRRVLLGR